MSCRKKSSSNNGNKSNSSASRLTQLLDQFDDSDLNDALSHLVVSDQGAPVLSPVSDEEELMAVDLHDSGQSPGDSAEGKALVGYNADRSSVSLLRFLLTSLIEMVCMSKESSPVNQAQLQRILAKQLVGLKIIPAVYYASELEPIKEKFRFAFSQLFRNSQAKLRSPAPGFKVNEEHRLALTSFLASGTGSPFRLLNPPDNRHNSISSSRYKTDFEEQCILGKGGFGQVFKVVNKLDGCHYAVKKIRFKVTDTAICFKVLREVKMLAVLQHPNVVRFYGAWLELEDVGVGHQKDIVDGMTASAEPYSNFGNFRVRKRKRSRKYSHSFGDQPWHGKGVNIRELSSSDESSLTNEGQGFFRNRQRKLSNPELSSRNWESDSRNKNCRSRSATCSIRVSESAPINSKNLQSPAERWSFLWSRSTASSSGSKSASKVESVLINNFVVPFRQKSLLDNISSMPGFDDSDHFMPLSRSLVLHMQMELCTLTLRDWLHDRNGSSYIDSKFELVSRYHNELLLKQLLKALEYIHAKFFIHRDIKPSNIFIRQPGLQLTLGDFGLACNSGQIDVDSTIDSDLPSTSATFAQNRNSFHSAGVGTITYSAPEQLKSNQYDEKVDIFSAGMIFFELLCPFQTHMEKIHTLVNLRNHDIEEPIERNWPVEVDLIKKMVSLNPQIRPCANSLLKCSIFRNKDEIIRALEHQVASQSEEINRLKKLLNKNQVDYSE